MRIKCAQYHMQINKRKIIILKYIEIYVNKVVNMKISMRLYTYFEQQKINKNLLLVAPRLTNAQFIKKTASGRGWSPCIPMPRRLLWR